MNVFLNLKINLKITYDIKLLTVISSTVNTLYFIVSMKKHDHIMLILLDDNVLKTI